MDASYFDETFSNPRKSLLKHVDDSSLISVGSSAVRYSVSSDYVISLGAVEMSVLGHGHALVRGKA